MTSPSTKRKPVLLALAASFLLTILIVVGSRNLEHYDAALFGYTIASVVAFGAIVFRYALWLQRPATRVYWRRGWKLYLQRDKFVQNTASAAKTLATNLIEQRFIFKRGFSRWAMHFLIMWGCVLSALITFPLVFAWVTFHALDFTAVMVIAGCAIAIHRRLRDRGAIALQQFTLDFVPHMLLIAISVTGLMLTASSLYLQGYMYHFIALTHQATVIMTLFYLPFGKLFHVVQRPASIGVELYQERAREMPQATCARCGAEFVAQLWLDDLKTVVDKLGFDYSMGDGKTLQDYCPRCKRIMRGLAYANLPQSNERVFKGSRNTSSTS